MREFKHPDLLKQRDENDRNRKFNEEYMRKVKSAVKKLFDGSEDGRLVFQYLMDYCDVFAMTMTGNSWTFFNEGKRDVGLMLLNLREMQWFDEVNTRRDEYLKKFEQGTKVK